MKPHLPLLKGTVLAALATLCLSIQTHAALVLQLQASDYNAGTGLWTADVGPNATAIGTPSTLGTTTTNGSSTVNFNGTTNFFTLATNIPAGSAYTAFVFAQINSTSGTPLSVFGTNTDGGGFQYRFYLGKQDALRQGQADLNSSLTALNTTDFYSANVSVSGSGGTFRLNGVNDGSTGGSGFSNSIGVIGNNTSSGPAEIFSGNIAEIRIYDTVLTDIERQAVEAQFTASYITPVPEPSSWLMMVGGLGMLVGFQRVRSTRA